MKRIFASSLFLSLVGCGREADVVSKKATPPKAEETQQSQIKYVTEIMVDSERSKLMVYCDTKNQKVIYIVQKQSGDNIAPVSVTTATSYNTNCQ